MHSNVPGSRGQAMHQCGPCTQEHTVNSLSEDSNHGLLKIVIMVWFQLA